MQTDASQSATHGAGALWLRAGLALAAVDFLWATVLTYLYGRSQASLWQGVASVPFGPRIAQAGATGVALGITAHVATAFFWAAVFVFALRPRPVVRILLETTPGAVLLGALYGPLIWCVMSLGVITVLTGKATPITWRWWVQLAGHAVFVGQPVVHSVRRVTRVR